MSKRKLNIIIGRTLLVLLVAGMFLLLVSGVRTKEGKLCAGLEIQIGLTEKKGFVNDKEVAAILKNELGRKPTGTPIKTFDLRSSEKALEENVWIKKAQLYFDNSNVLHVQVSQRIPVARIIDNSGASYYLDSTGFTLPLSNSDRADVPVFTSVPIKRSATLQNVILGLASSINADSFWLAQAAQINWLPGNRFELYPAFGNHVVALGNALDPANKLARLKMFYKTVSVKKGFDAYPRISVEFDRQVLAIKTDSVAPLVDAGKAVQVFDQIVKANRITANNDKENVDVAKGHKSKNEATPQPEIKAVADHPPDEKNKGNPQKIVSKEPKAVMPKTNHN